jgi:hypothetical protein
MAAIATLVERHPGSYLPTERNELCDSGPALSRPKWEIRWIMASVSVRLSKAQIEDLAAICGLGVGRLNQMAEALYRAKPSVGRQGLRRVIAEAAGDERAAAAAMRALPALAIAARRFYVTPSDLLSSIRENLENQGWQDLRKWHECQPVIEKILGLPAVILPAKARELAVDFERFYTRARILTDIRPVFSDAKTEILGADISQTLRLDYTSRSDSAATLSLALDTADIEELKKCCEEALQKASVVRQDIENKWGLEVALPGEHSR